MGPHDQDRGSSDGTKVFFSDSPALPPMHTPASVPCHLLGCTFPPLPASRPLRSSPGTQGPAAHLTQDCRLCHQLQPVRSCHSALNKLPGAVVLKFSFDPDVFKLKSHGPHFTDAQTEAGQRSCPGPLSKKPGNQATGVASEFPLPTQAPMAATPPPDPPLPKTRSPQPRPCHFSPQCPGTFSWQGFPDHTSLQKPK
jgi:hypothetical protein